MSGDAGDAQNTLVEKIAAAKAGRNVIVSVLSPGAVLLPWNDQVPAIIMGWMPGQEAGNAFADVLFGSVNPSGKLPVTIPNKDNEIGMTAEQYPGTGIPRDAIYSEKLLVGYRWYDSAQIAPLYPFGYGLSYSSFVYENMQVEFLPASKLVPHSPTYKKEERLLPVVRVSLDVRNTGAMGGAEVVQCYVSFPASAQEPPQQLRHFVKIFVNPMETQHVEMTLSLQDLSVWNVASSSMARGWSVVWDEPYIIGVGSHSRDIRLNQSIHFSS